MNIVSSRTLFIRQTNGHLHFLSSWRSQKVNINNTVHRENYNQKAVCLLYWWSISTGDNFGHFLKQNWWYSGENLSIIQDTSPVRVSSQRYQDLDSVSESKLSRGEQGGESIVSWSIWLNLRKTERDNFTFFIIPCTFKLSFTLNLCMSRRQRWGWPFSAAKNKAWSPFRSLLPGCLQTDSLFCKDVY